MEREALLYQKLPDGRVQCGVCQRRCIVAEGERGWCCTRKNRRGRLVSLTYGEVSSVSVNPIEKKPVFHFHPGSRWLSLGGLGCNFRCPGCQNWDIAHFQGGTSRGTSYLSPEEQVELAKARSCIGLSWTFNEPTLWFEYTLDTARIARKHGLFTNYVTNGYITEEAMDLLAPHLDVYRVDIKGFSPTTYKKVAGGVDVEGIPASDGTRQAGWRPRGGRHQPRPGPQRRRRRVAGAGVLDPRAPGARDPLARDPLPTPPRPRPHPTHAGPDTRDKTPERASTTS